MFRLVREVSVRTKGLSEWVEGSMLKHGGGIVLLLVQDKSGSSLVIQLSHVLLALISIFSVNQFFLE